jgi:hypothetical protein
MDTGIDNFLTPVQSAPVSTPPLVETPAPTPTIRSDLFSNPEYRFTPNRGLGADDIRNDPQRMETIRNYMRARKGAHMDEYEDAELYDTFMNHMRSFNVNEITTGGEFIWVNRASDENKQLANEAYTIYDSLSNVFTNDGVSGAFDGVRDYIWSGATAPSTWLGGIIGKVATAPARAAVRQQAGNVVRSAVTARVAAPAGDVATQAALEVAERQAREITAQAARTAALKEVGIAIATDATLTAGQDVIRQATLMNVGAQDRYSALETILSSGLGVIGGLPPGVSYITRQRDATDIAVRSAVVSQRNAEEALGRAIPELEKAFEAFSGRMINWQESVDAGRRIVGGDFDLATKVTRTLLSTDPEEEASVVNAMIRAGVGLRRGDGEDGVTAQLASFAKALSPEKKAELDLVFQKNLNGMSFDELVDIMVSAVSQSGSVLKLPKDAADAIGKALAARKLADDTNIGLSGEALRKAIDGIKEESNPDVIRYVQSAWRRALVSHPATTAVNVLGWAQVEAFKGVAEILHGGVLGTAGLAAKLISPVSAKAGKWADKAILDSKALITSQLFKARTLLSPSSSRDIFEAILDESSPKRVKELKDSLYGGIDGTSERYGISKANRAVKMTENYLDVAGRFSLLKVQDIYTKSMSFVTELDKQLRLVANTDLSTILKRGDLSLIPDEVFDRATKATLKSVMSADYTRGRGVLSKLAASVEAISNMPLIGFIFPFGRFMNNQLGFIMEYSPLGILPELGRMRQKGLFNNPDLFEAASKALVGSAAFTILMNYSREHQEQGYAWYEITDRTGTVINVQNMAPISSYMAAARYMDAVAQRQTTPELLNELVAQMGALSMMSTVQSDPLGEIVKYVNSLTDDKEGLDIFNDFLGGLAPFFTGVASGFTRPLEPLDAVVGSIRDTDAAVDRRQLTGAEQAYRGATRYVENTFLALENILGANEPIEDMVGPQRQDASQFGPVRDPNPMSRMIGFREQPGATNITRLFNAVNIPVWTIQERTGIPEWDALMNEIITPRLDMKARELMNGRLYKSASLAGRERMVRAMLREVRQDTIRMIEEQLGADPNILRMRQAFTRKPMSLRREAREALNITTKDRELSYVEIQQLQAYIDMIEDREKLIR